MSDRIYIDDVSMFVDEQALYQWLLDLHKEYEVGDLTELLQFFINNERTDYYLTVKKFIANELKE